MEKSTREEARDGCPERVNYNSVPHNLLIAKMRSVGFHGKLLNWFSDYLDNRSFRVVVDGKVSDWKPVKSCVPQGAVLGPFLFLLYINDLPRILQPCYVLLYADDLKLFKLVSSVKDCEVLQDSLNKLYDWSNIWQLHLNLSKCFVISYTMKTQRINFQYSIHAETLTRQFEATDLGISIASNWSFNKHIGEITKKAFKTLGFLKRNSDHLGLHTIIKLYISLVRSKLEYASIIWNPHTQLYSNQMERVQRKFIKFLRYSFHLDYDSEKYWEYCEQYSLLPLFQRRFVSDCLFLHKSVRQQNPPIDFLEFLNNPSVLTRHNRLFHIPQCRINVRFYFPTYRILRAFNTYNLDFSLPIDIFLDTCIIASKTLPCN